MNMSKQRKSKGVTGARMSADVTGEKTSACSGATTRASPPLAHSGPPTPQAFVCSSSRVSRQARTTVARLREGKRGEGEDRARRAVRGRHEVGAEALWQAAIC